MIKGVFLDCMDITRGDISWEPMEKLCDYTYYLESTEEEAKARLRKNFTVCYPLFSRWLYSTD
jgi:hypothetical protein